MKQENLSIENIPAIIYGEKSKNVYLYIHGKDGYKEEAEHFALSAEKNGFQVLSIDLPGYGERKSEIDNFVPWRIVPELQLVMKNVKQRWDSVSLYANSIGAYCSIMAFQNDEIKSALMVSPVVDMIKLIQNMMTWANVTEETLEKEKIIPTSFGEKLDWEYYQYVRKNQTKVWNHSTKILYAGKDNLTDRFTIDEFVKSNKCKLTVMEDGEHWFHTEEQLLFLDNWIKENIL